MDKKNIKIHSKIHDNLTKAARTHNLSIMDFTHACLNYFIVENIDPRKPPALKEVRDVLISFIKMQEKTFLLPAKENDSNVKLTLEELSHDIKAIKVAQREINDLITKIITK